MILNFKTQINGVPTNFKEKILSGQKIHTIRKKGRWKEKNIIHFSNFARSKNYDNFKIDVTQCIQDVVIIPSKSLGKNGKIFVQGRSLKFYETMEFSKNDGFDTLFDFWDWFKEGGEFDLIHWTDKRY